MSSTGLARTCCTLLLCTAGAWAGELEIHVIDVGQGAAAFVRGPTGTRLLIDCGNPGQGSSVVRPYLLSIGVTDLDYSVITHWHTDHMGGADELFNAGMKPNLAAYDRGDLNKPSNSEVTGYLASVSGVRQFATLGQVLPLGDGATLQFVALNGTTLAGNVDINASAQYENSASIGMLIRYKDFDAYIAGDLTAGGSGTSDVETLAAQAVGQVEVAQSSHHGSNTSSSQSAVDLLAPSLVLHSCGFENDYGHPKQTIIDRWSTIGATRAQWCTTEGDSSDPSSASGLTAANGTIVIASDGWSFSARRTSGSEVLRCATFERPGAPPAAGKLVLSELLNDPQSVSDSYGEWFELSSTGPQSYDLFGTRFVSGSDSFTLASRILLGPGERLLIGVDGKPSRNGQVFSALCPPWEDFNLVNSSSSLRVEAPGGTVLDSVAWGTGGFPVQAGVARERIDLFAAGTPANFAAAGAAWAGADKGSPNGGNGADGTAWPAQLGVQDPWIGGLLRFELASLDEPLAYSFLGLSSGSTPGMEALGLHLDLNLDSLFLAYLPQPGFFAALDAQGRRSVELPLPADPSLLGLSAYAQQLTLKFVPIFFSGSKVSNLVQFTVGQ